MTKRFFLLFMTCCLIFFFSSCSISVKGNTLTAFINRINENGDYTLAAEGFIYDEKGKNLTKFFTIGEDELMLQLELNNKSEIIGMHIILDNSKKINTYTQQLTEEFIISFVNNDNICNKITEEVNISKIHKRKYMKTNKKTIGSIDILIDTTDIGVVITLLKNNL